MKDVYSENNIRILPCRYSLRAHPEATISTPLEWRELKKGLRPEEFNIFTILKRKNDPREGLLENKHALEVG